MSAQLKVFVKNVGRYVDFNGGDTLIDIYRDLKDEIADTPICARVNNKTEDLQFPLFSPKQVEFLSASTDDGRKVYVRTLVMMLYRALEKLYPGTRLVVEHSIAQGYYCRLTGDRFPGVNAETIDALKQQMSELVRLDLPIMRKERLTSDVSKIFERQGLADKVRLLNTLGELYTVYYVLDGVADSFYGCLAPSTGMCPVFNLEPFKDGLLLMGPDTKRLDMPSTPKAQEKLYKAFTDYLAFNRVIGVDDAGTFNTAVRHHDTPMLINVAEAMHDKRIGRISDRILERYQQGGAKIVFIAGPSSSGKTTFTKRLAIQLTTNLLEPCMISLDDYFVNRVNTPLDENGEYDYESIHALDLATFNNDLSRLLAGEEVELPTYNFELGQRVYKGNRLKLSSRSVLLIEGIHGLNPELSAGIEPEKKFLIYVSALTTISIDDHNWVPTTDNRLLRRIIRDFKYRGVSAADTIKRWPSVRRGEDKWIFPYQENADEMFNSSLIFELGVMRPLAEDVLQSVPRNAAEYAVSHRLMRLLSYFSTVPERFIPSTSLLREFLGGSSFRY